MIRIPLRVGVPFYDLQVPLDGTTYTLQVRWNTRYSAWYMDVLDEQGSTMLVGGLALLLGAAISAKVTGRPYPGFFVMLDTSGTNVDAGFSDLGDRVLLEYLEAADLAAMGI